MKRLFMPSSILLLFMVLFVASCSTEEIESESVDLKLEIEKPQEKRGLQPISCGWGFLEMNEFDGDYLLDEQVLIIWDVLLCGTTDLPDTMSIYFRKNSGLPIYHTIVSDISPFFKSDPTASIIGNFLWDVNDPALVVGENYTMILQDEENGAIVDYHDFTISGSTAPTDCDFGLTNELDGDYRIRFYVDNNNECFTNIQYDIDYGDGDTASFVSNNDNFSFAHQYPFGVYGVYNVNVTKSNPITGDILSTRATTATAKRD